MGSRKCGRAPASAMGSIFSCPLFLCERFFLGKQKEMRISNDGCSYLMNGQVVIHDEDRTSFYSSIKATFNGCDSALL
jgi:hypothetical protein